MKLSILSGLCFLALFCSTEIALAQNMRKFKARAIWLDNQTSQVGSKEPLVVETLGKCPTCRHDYTMLQQIVPATGKNKRFSFPYMEVTNILAQNNNLEVVSFDMGKRELFCSFGDGRRRQEPVWQNFCEFFLNIPSESRHDNDLIDKVTAKWDERNRNHIDSYRHFTGERSSQEALDLLEQCYELFLKSLQSLSSDAEYIIPPVLHQIWFGSQLPLKYQKLRRSWSKLHPNWNRICWTEKLLTRFFSKGLFNQEAFNSAIIEKNYAKMADIFRVEAIERYGGLYSDMDMKAVENFDALNKSCSFYGPIASREFPSVFTNFILAGTPNNSVISAIKKTIHKNHARGETRFFPYYFGPGAVASGFYQVAFQEGPSVGGPVMLPDTALSTNRYSGVNSPIYRFAYHLSAGEWYGIKEDTFIYPNENFRSLRTNLFSLLELGRESDVWE